MGMGITSGDQSGPGGSSYRSFQTIVSCCAVGTKHRTREPWANLRRNDPCGDTTPCAFQIHTFQKAWLLRPLLRPTRPRPCYPSSKRFESDFFFFSGSSEGSPLICLGATTQPPLYARAHDTTFYVHMRRGFFFSLGFISDRERRAWRTQVGMRRGIKLDL